MTRQDNILQSIKKNYLEFSQTEFENLEIQIEILTEILNKSDDPKILDYFIKEINKKSFKTLSISNKYFLYKMTIKILENILIKDINNTYNIYLQEIINKLNIETNEEIIFAIISSLKTIDLNRNININPIKSYLNTNNKDIKAVTLKCLQNLKS